MYIFWWEGGQRVVVRETVVPVYCNMGVVGIVENLWGGDDGVLSPGCA